MFCIRMSYFLYNPLEIFIFWSLDDSELQFNDDSSLEFLVFDYIIFYNNLRYKYNIIYNVFVHL